MRISKHLISLSLCLLLIFSLCSCETTTEYYESDEIVSVIEYPSGDNESEADSVETNSNSSTNTSNNATNPSSKNQISSNTIKSENEEAYKYEF